MNICIGVFAHCRRRPSSWLSPQSVFVHRLPRHLLESPSLFTCFFFSSGWQPRGLSSNLHVASFVRSFVALKMKGGAKVKTWRHLWRMSFREAGRNEQYNDLHMLYIHAFALICSSDWLKHHNFNCTTKSYEPRINWWMFPKPHLLWANPNTFKPWHTSCKTPLPIEKCLQCSQ